jgi:hypothetical protein
MGSDKDCVNEKKTLPSENTNHIRSNSNSIKILQEAFKFQYRCSTLENIIKASSKLIEVYTSDDDDDLKDSIHLSKERLNRKED